MKIAVIGAGLAGLASTYYLLQQNFEVTVFDGGSGASAASTGLLHPFVGKQALPSVQWEEGMEATNGLIQVAEKALGKPVAERSGILRPAISEQQKTDFSKRGIWWEADQVVTVIPRATKAPALWIPNGVTVYTKLYLSGLWKACEKLGAKKEMEKVSLKSVDHFDRILLTTGAETIGFEECRELALKLTMGQSLICRCSERLPFGLISQGHIAPTEDPTLCWVGATYEHTLEPDPKKATALLEKVADFYPPARDFEILEIRSGTRISPKEGYWPITVQINSKTWVFTGLGSRGLLYHALFAKKLSESIK